MAFNVESGVEARVEIMGKVNVFESAWFLVGELVFCLAFLSACEIPNWTKGPYSPNQCVDRWMFTAGLFFPSSVQATTQPSAHRGRDTTK